MSDRLVLCQLTYDIPEETGIDPCPRLRRIAAHVQLSSWVIPQHLVPHAYLNELAERGVTWDLLRFDSSEAEKLIAIATRGITKDLNKTVKDARRAIDQAEAEYHDPERRRGKNQGVPLTSNEFADRASKAAQRALEVVGDLEEAARVFGIDATALPVTWAAEQARVLRSAAHDRAKRYAEAGKVAAQVGGMAGQSIANAARQDEVPVNVLADFVAEHGAQDEADSLMAAFADDPEPVAVGAGGGDDEPLTSYEKLSWE